MVGTSTTAIEDYSGRGFVDVLDYNTFVKTNLDALRPVLKAGGMDSVKQAWIDTRVREELKNLHEMSEQETVDGINNLMPKSLWQGWVRAADSEYKPAILEHIITQRGGLNIMLNDAYHIYQSNGGKLPFKRWLYTPMILYRGVSTSNKGLVKDDVFVSYTPNISVAKGFIKNGGTIQSVRLKPVNTYGGTGYEGEQEIFVPRKYIK